MAPLAVRLLEKDVPNPGAFLELLVRVAVLIDGGFFLKRYVALNKHKKSFDRLDYKQTATDIHKAAIAHVNSGDELYRVFFYDCPPLTKKTQNPISKNPVDFSKSDTYAFRCGLFEELKKKRKVALRLGELRDGLRWAFTPDTGEQLLKNKITHADLDENSVFYDVHQKGVDIKIGIDIASLAYKQQVQQIVLISGDSDFVPAAKLARREGIDFILDPMWNQVSPALFEHIDGLTSTSPKPPKKP